MKVRIEKILYGGFYTLRRVYKDKEKVMGIITKNPHTEKYEVLISDFKNQKYITKEFNKFSEARKYLIKEYEDHK